jgi:hypothetical protein
MKASNRGGVEVWRIVGVTACMRHVGMKALRREIVEVGRLVGAQECAVWAGSHVVESRTPASAQVYVWRMQMRRHWA